MEEEITFELTNYCPHNCKFCSSNAINNNHNDVIFIDLDTIQNILRGKKYKHIILSGGEPLSHPKFYQILNICKMHTDDVVIYSNAITHLIYNPHVIDGVYLEANITVTPETDKIHILRRVKQGREKNRPEVHLSNNHKSNCSCNKRVVRPNGEISKHPCDKWYTTDNKKIKL